MFDDLVVVDVNGVPVQPPDDTFEDQVLDQPEDVDAQPPLGPVSQADVLDAVAVFELGHQLEDVVEGGRALISSASLHEKEVHELLAEGGVLTEHPELGRHHVLVVVLEKIQYHYFYRRERRRKK